MAGPYRRGTWHEAGVRRSATPTAKSDEAKLQRQAQQRGYKLVRIEEKPAA
jgi:hypothetical protein